MKIDYSVMVFVGYMLSLAMVLVFLITFIKAYLHPSKSVHVYIDVVGEAHVEFILLIFVFGFVLLGLYCSYKSIKKA